MSPSSSSRIGSPWTEPRIKRLADLWRDGKSASEVAAALGVTRNAVIGKVHRLGLSGDGRHAQARPAKPSTQRPSRPRAVRAPPGPQRAFVTEALTGLVPCLEDLPRRACHWPIGDPKAEDFAFCGRRADVQPYCPVHRAVAVAPRGKKQ
jgi:GcrA cell cycle regulator